MAEYIINAIALFITAWLISKIPCCQSNRGEFDVSEILTKRHAAPKIPQHEIDSIASCLLPAMRRFFESEDGKREFEAWKAETVEREGVKRKKVG